MLGKVLEVLWHDYKAIFSVDVSSLGTLLVSTGADKAARIWKIDQGKREQKVDGDRDQSMRVGGKAVEDMDVEMEYQADLDHQSTVNVARFAPGSDSILGTGSDGGEIRIWMRNDRRRWTTRKVLAGHAQDVLDLSWNCNHQLASSSVDNSVIVWDTSTGTAIQKLLHHVSYVQGVSFDPLNEFLVSQSSDRSVQVLQQTPLSSFLSVGSCTSNLFADDDVCFFSRRLSWSPDGSFFACPGGLYAGKSREHCVHVFARGMWSSPFATLRGFENAVRIVRFCPTMFKPSCKKTMGSGENDDQKVFSLPHRVVFAAATRDTVVLFDTESDIAIASAAGLHYEPITDLAWQADGRALFISSVDGYLSVLRFEKDELGEELPRKDELDEQLPHKVEDGGQRNQKQRTIDLAPIETFDSEQVRLTIIRIL